MRLKQVMESMTFDDFTLNVQLIDLILLKLT